ncbi:hypothetical protein EfmAA290_16860 [Enterococcus faecium]|nr:hypothetical protein EfmAA290_16860 [Enterococcus faecium]
MEVLEEIVKMAEGFAEKSGAQLMITQRYPLRMFFGKTYI